MKKIFLMLLAALTLCACSNVEQVQAAKDFEITPLFSTKSNAQNKIWVGTFQLAFNDMKNKVLKLDKIEFVNEKPTDELIGLNKEEFNSSMLNESSYFTSYGAVSEQAKEGIKKGIKEKFNETSDIIDELDWTPDEGKYYAYAMLKKQFEFLEAFDKLDDAPFNNSDEKYKYFGIKDDSKKELDNNIHVFFYNNENDYAISLKTTNNDQVYLYRTDKNADFKTLYDEMNKKSLAYEGESEFRAIDTFKAPNLKINEIRKYTELLKKTIAGTYNPPICFKEAIETIQLELDNKGGKVKSEAIIMTMKNSLVALDEEPKPRHFNFDKPFVMFLIDSGKNDPYLALRADDLKYFQK